ncbi:hypothetical protein AKO1_015053 [Acrasis kona]|uniref:Uncharacterized protein n=1 Tax=Acrasis kona TaxID=1008807 RepID=A0AAW2YQA4_9EUKA
MTNHTNTNTTTDGRTEATIQTTTTYLYLAFFVYSLACLLMILKRRRHAEGSRMDVAITLTMFPFAYFMLSVYYLIRLYAPDLLHRLCIADYECPLNTLIENLGSLLFRCGYFILTCFWFRLSRHARSHVNELSPLLQSQQISNHEPQEENIRREKLEENVIKHRVWSTLFFSILTCIILCCIASVLPYYLLGYYQNLKHFTNFVLLPFVDVCIVIMSSISGWRLLVILRHALCITHSITTSLLRHLKRICIFSIVFSCYWALVAGFVFGWRVAYCFILDPSVNPTLWIIFRFVSVLCADLLPYAVLSIALVWMSTTVRAFEFIYNRTMSFPSQEETPFDDEATPPTVS